VFFASVMIAFTARRRRGDSRAVGRTMPAAEIQQLDRAMESGHVPLDAAESSALRGLADRRIRQARFYMWFGNLVWLAMLALSLTLLVTTGSLASVAEAALFAFFLVWGTVVMRRQQRRAEIVKGLLDQQGPDPAAKVASAP
jgi:hypothetical protein